MASRLELHEELCEILGTNSVYFQPPASVKMSYDCIRYSLSGIVTKQANNKNYKKTNKYEIVVISRNPDCEVFNKLLDHFPMCRFDRHYVADNLNHWVLTLHY